MKQLTFALAIAVASVAHGQEYLVDTDTLEAFDCVAFYNPELEPLLPMERDVDTSYIYPKHIKVAVHVLTCDTIPEWHVPLGNIEEAIYDLNEQYEGTQFSFSLHDSSGVARVTYTDVNDYGWGEAWINYDYAEDGAYGMCFYSAMNQMDQYAEDVNYNTNEYLNIYVVPKLCRTLLGFSWVHFNPYSDVYGVWVVQRAFGLSGDYLDFPYVENKTLVHEVGHYLGLHHVFNRVRYCGQDLGLCNLSGDMVCDTPPTKVNYSCVNPVCPPSLYGYTPNNHMDYYPDSCRTTFTPGQIDRMHFMTDYHHPDMFSDAEPFCMGDFNGDGYVGTLDLVHFLSCYDGPSLTEGCFDADLSNDGTMSVLDLTIMLNFYGYNCADNPNTFESQLSEHERQRIMQMVHGRKSE